jgi:starch synthase
MRILFATPELAPWVKTGGLGDVAAALPVALRTLGVDMRVLVPAYPALLDAFADAAPVADIAAPGGILPSCRLLQATADNGLTLLLVDFPEYYRRHGSPYVGADGRDWPDNHLRFALLAKVAALLASDTSPLPWRPEILHTQDWQTALAPAYLHYQGGAHVATVMTIHNLAFQGNFPPWILREVDLPEQCFHHEELEFYGQVSYLKAGLLHADRITTVSPNYAREIRTAEFGFGLEGLLSQRADRLVGILNGIDERWNPAGDPFIAAPFDADRLEAKQANKVAVQERLRLAKNRNVPLLGVVSRMTHQKGLDWLLDIIPKLVPASAQLVMLGSGEAALEQAFVALAAKHPKHMAVTVGFDEARAHQIEAGADIFLMPSRFEPCGLNQMYSQRYGTPPVVRAVGGLAETVVDLTDATLADGSATGFTFREAGADALLAAVQRALAAWCKPEVWQQLQRNGMGRDFSWRPAAQAYLELYKELLAQ